MQGLAKQFIPLMYTKKQLIDFGNFLLDIYGVMVHSDEGHNNPLYKREVSDADFRNWETEHNVNSSNLPSRFQVGDKVIFEARPDDHDIPYIGLPAEILAVHFYSGKVKYDVDLIFAEGKRTRIYNVDSIVIVDFDK